MGNRALAFAGVPLLTLMLELGHELLAVVAGFRISGVGGSETSVIYVQKSVVHFSEETR